MAPNDGDSDDYGVEKADQNKQELDQGEEQKFEPAVIEDPDLLLFLKPYNLTLIKQADQVKLTEQIVINHVNLIHALESEISSI